MVSDGHWATHIPDQPELRDLALEHKLNCSLTTKHLKPLSSTTLNFSYKTKYFSLLRDWIIFSTVLGHPVC